MKARRFGNTLAWQVLICVAVLSIWQWGYDLHAIAPHVHRAVVALARLLSELRRVA